MPDPIGWGWWNDPRKAANITKLTGLVPASRYRFQIKKFSFKLTLKSVTDAAKDKHSIGIYDFEGSRAEPIMPPALSNYVVETKDVVTVKPIEKKYAWEMTGPTLPLPNKVAKQQFLPKIKMKLLAGKLEGNYITFACVQVIDVPTDWEYTNWVDNIFSSYVQPGETKMFETIYSGFSGQFINYNGALATRFELVRPAGKSKTSWYDHAMETAFGSIATEAKTRISPAALAPLLGVPTKTKVPTQIADKKDYLLWKVTVRYDTITLLRDTSRIALLNSSFINPAFLKEKATFITLWDKVCAKRNIKWKFKPTFATTAGTINGLPIVLVGHKHGMTMTGKFPPPRIPSTWSSSTSYSAKKLKNDKFNEEITMTTTVKEKQGKTIAVETNAPFTLTGKVPWVYVARSMWQDYVGNRLSNAVALYISLEPLPEPIISLGAETLGNQTSQLHHYRGPFCGSPLIVQPWFTVEHVLLENQRWTDWVQNQIDERFVDYGTLGANSQGACPPCTYGDCVTDLTIPLMSQVWNLPWIPATYHVYIMRHRWDTTSNGHLLNVLKGLAE